MQGRALAADCWARGDGSTQVNQVQLNKHALSKRKFPVQSSSFLFTVSVHSPDDPKGWDNGCVQVTVSTKGLRWLVPLMHMVWLSPDHIWQLKKTLKIKKNKLGNILIYVYISCSCPWEFLLQFVLNKTIYVCFVIFENCIHSFKHYICLPCKLRPRKRNACVCFTQQLTTSEGLALKPCNVSNCFPAIIPPSSLTQLPVTSPDKGHTMESYFLCRHTRMYTYALTPRAYLRAHTSTHAHSNTPRNDTIVLRVARCCCNIWLDRVAGLAQHQCLRTRWWAFADRALVHLLL